MRCDAAEFAGLYEGIYRELYYFALCMMKNVHDAEDAVGEAVVRGYEKRGMLRDEAAFKSWMFTILANVCKKTLKKESKIRVVPMSEYMPEPDAPDLDLWMDLYSAFEKLAEEERLVVGLSVFGGYQSKEIGKILKLKDTTVRSKRSRALGKLGVLLERRTVL